MAYDIGESYGFLKVPSSAEAEGVHVLYDRSGAAYCPQGMSAFRFDPVELPAECEALRALVRQFIAAELVVRSRHMVSRFFFPSPSRKRGPRAASAVPGRSGFPLSRE